MRVVVAEDVMLTREGIVHLLREAGIEVVAECGDPDELLRRVELDRPDAAIVDIRMPPTHTDEGLTAAQRIRDEHPSVAVLLLSHYVEPSYALRLLEEHPERVGYLLKDRVFDGAVLVDALRRLSEDETVVDPTIVSRLLGRRRQIDPLADLTAREREVLSLVAAAEIRRRYPRTGVLVLSQHLEPRYALRLLEEAPGGVGYLLKERVGRIAELEDALARVSAGECVVDHAVVDDLLTARRERDPLAELSTREREILELMAEGRSNQGICERLYLSPKTVETHVRSLFGKLGLQGAPQDNRRVLAVLTYLRAG